MDCLRILNYTAKIHDFINLKSVHQAQALQQGTITVQGV